MTGSTCTASPTALIMTMQILSACNSIPLRTAPYRVDLTVDEGNFVAALQLVQRALEPLEIGSRNHRVPGHVEPDAVYVEHISMSALGSFPRDEHVSRIEVRMMCAGPSERLQQLSRSAKTGISISSRGHLLKHYGEIVAVADL